MRGPDRVDTALTGVSAATALALVVTRGGGLAEWLFGAVLLTALARVLRTVAEDWRRAGRERRHAADLMAAEPTAVARAAVLEERRRLSFDIAERLRRHLESIVSLSDAAAADADPRPALRRIHRAARTASSELRRELGLLRDEAAPAPVLPEHAPVRLTRTHLLIWSDLLSSGRVRRPPE